MKYRSQKKQAAFMGKGKNMFLKQNWALLLLFTCVVAFAGDVKWKPYGTAKIEQKSGSIDIQFDCMSLSGIQAATELERGKYKMCAEMSGEGRVFLGIYNGSKWTYSPDFKLSSHKKTFSFTFSTNKEGKYLVVLLARKNSCKALQVSRIWVQNPEENSANTSPATVVVPACSSNHTLPELPVEGLVSASFARTAPVIDGKLDDQIWKNNSVTLSSFLTHKTMTPCKEDSEVQIAYDKEHLYIGFKGYALALQAKSNQFASFIQSSVRTDDPQLFNDDYFAFLLADPENCNAFEFFFNARGTVADAKTTLANLWRNRDVKWNSNARISARTEEGFWCLEAAIPWKNLGLAAEQGKKLYFHAGRSNVRIHEKSSWQFVKKSFHDPKAMGHLILGDENPFVKIIDLPVVPQKSCRFEARSTWDSLVLNQEVNGAISSFGSKSGCLTAMLNVEEAGIVRYRYSIYDSNSKSVIVCSPLYEIFADFPKFAVIGNSVPVYVNGEAVTAESSNGQIILLGGKSGGNGKVTVFNREENQVAFEITDDSSSCPQMTLCGKQLSLADGFLYSKTIPSSASSGKWRLVSFDDSDWVPADVYSELKRGFYRKKYLSETTVVGPNWNEKSPLYINAGMIQPLLLSPTGIKGKTTPHGCHLIVETPVTLELLGASCFYKAFPSGIIEEKRLGDIRRYRINFPNLKKYQDIANGLYQWCCLAFRASANATGNEVIYCYWTTPDGKNTLVPRAVPVKFMPQLRSAETGGILQFWTWPLTEVRDRAMCDAMFNSILQVGANEIEDGRANAGKYSFRKITLAPWSLDFRDFIKTHPGTALVRNDGSAHKTNACPLAIISPEGEKFMHEAFMRYLEKWPRRPIRIIWDFESSAWNGLAACSCQKCRNSFAAKFKLDKIPENIREIRENYSAKWIRFQTENCARIIKNLHKETVMAKIPFSVYSGYHNDFTKENYSIDWSRLAGNIELAVCGYGQSGKALDRTINALSPTPMLNSLLLQPYAITNPMTPVPVSCAKIIKTVLDSNANGAMIFQYFLMDGRTFAAIAKASRIMAENERFFAGTPAKGWQSTYTDIHFKQSGNEILVIAVNDSADERECSFIAPNGSVNTVKLQPNGIVSKLYNISEKCFVNTKNLEK